MTIDFAKLADPFPAEDIEWRVQSSGKKGDKVWARVLAYVTNRAIQERLDAVAGPGNWRNEFTTGPGGGVLCGISIRVERADGTYEWVTKYDGAENTDIEAIKGGLSGAMKRAAVQWGIGRILYKLPAGWAQIEADKKKALHSDKLKESKEWFYWNPPNLPAWALPEGTKTADGYPLGDPPYQPEPETEPPPAKKPDKPTPGQLSELVKLGEANDLDKAAIAKLSTERFNAPPSKLKPHQFAALWDRVNLGDWLPDDIDKTMNPKNEEEAA